MNRRKLLALCGLAAGSTLLAGFGRKLDATEPVGRGAAPFTRLDKPFAEWRKLLPAAAFGVLFEENTERAFSSPLDHEKRGGTYVCAACFLPLFDAKTKFDSGTGWPSFFQPIPKHVGTKEDRFLFVLRTEYHCARCSGHQGHVFDDGPKPTGQRWCNNGLALAFIPAGQALPPLRT
jgi:peptide-methionine (R)-S-oxide reductase